MKQILPKLKELNKHLNFAKKAFTKGGFRHATTYINGLITINRKTVKKISQASIEENHHSAIFSTIAYAILKLFMLCRSLVMTIGECVAYIQDREMDNFIREIVGIEDKSERMTVFEEVFIRKTAKV